MAFFPIAEYRPDVADINGQFTDDICNVIPADGSYIPMPSFEVFTGNLMAKPLGGIAVRAVDGTTLIFCGTDTGLYMLDNTDLTWKNIGKENFSYSANEDARWSFAAFGNYVIAVNKNDAPQVFIIGQASRFRNLGGDPPRAGLVRVWGDFVCLMQLPDFPNRVHWSGLNDAEWWTVGQKNCDYQNFPDGGNVQGSSETTNPIVFLQTAIYRATFVPGSDIIFSFQKIHDKRGAKSAASIACRGSYAFYADEGGFFQISMDGTINPIGFEKVDRSVFSKLNAVDISSMFGAIDPFYSRVYWITDYLGTGIFREMLIYDWGLQRWSLVNVETCGVLPIYNAGYTLDGLDRVSMSLEALPFSLDSKAWQGGAPILGAFSADYRLGAFSGTGMEAIVSSQEIGSTAGSVQRISSVFAAIDTDQAFLSVGTRFRRNLYDPIRWGVEKLPSYNSGRYHMRARGRFHKFRLRVPVGEVWKHVKGFDVDFNFAGMR
ncbi:hypothetical protein [Bartonella sp. HY038]|uniref:hypothetical protein n=1 Tax=Bartonella sp. HY038 TaxID=2759660 RepID=UPI0015FBB2FD|nr:hypothetical protein [Bartonella sp. HY038]